MKQAEARDMARMLDVLDRQLNSEPGNSEKQPNDASGSADNILSKDNCRIPLDRRTRRASRVWFLKETCTSRN